MPLAPQDIEIRFGISLPQRFVAALADPSDAIHTKAQLLAPEGNDLQSIFAVNAKLRASAWKEWPEYLVAFATNECGDYFAFDARVAPYRVYYVGPIDTAPEGIAQCEREGFVFESFEDWCQRMLSARAA